MAQFSGYDIIANHEQDLEYLRRHQEPFALGSAGSRKNESVDPRSVLKVEMQWSLSSCFPPGTLVRTASSQFIPIEEIRVLTEVISAEGNICKVMQVMAKPYSGEMITIKSYGHGHLRCTPEHPILTKRGYVPACELTKNDMIAFTKGPIGGVRKSIRPSEYVEVPVRAKNDRSWTSSSVRGRGCLSMTAKAVPDEIALDYDFGRLIGLFLSEGNTTRSQIVWTFCTDEEETLVAETARILNSKFGMNTAIVKHRTAKAMKVVMCGSVWADLFTKLCATGAGRKELHPDLSSANIDFLKGVFDGWIDGDGYTHKRGHTTGTTISKKLALQMFTIANFLGKRPSIQFRVGKASHGVASRQNIWNLAVVNSGNNSYRCDDEDRVLWRKVKELVRSDYDGYVYNLSVSDDESYVAEGIGVHNCTGNAITTGMEALHGFQCGDFSKAKQLSRMYAYLKGQQVFGNFGRDSGCGIAAIVKAMYSGCCEESVFPYPSAYTTKIPSGAEQAAAAHKLNSHAMAEDADQAIDAMDGCGVLDFGTIWTGAMHNFRGLMLDLEHVREDGSRSGHSYAGVGFVKHQGEEHIIIANSHSERWAQGGYALMTKRAFNYLVGRPYSVIALLFSVTGAERKKNNIVNFQDWA